jgi:hypothetical protein
MVLVSKAVLLELLTESDVWVADVDDPEPPPVTD